MLYRDKGLPKRLTDYFAENPDEELTIEIAILKFDAKPTAVATAISRLCEAGILESVRVIRLPAKGRASHGDPMAGPIDPDPFGRKPSLADIQRATAVLDANPAPKDGRMIEPRVDAVGLHAYDLGET
jgi:hypothetical protein